MTGAGNLTKPVVANLPRVPDAPSIWRRLLVNVGAAPRLRGPVRTWVSGAENLAKPSVVVVAYPARVGVRTVRTVRAWLLKPHLFSTGAHQSSGPRARGCVAIAQLGRLPLGMSRPNL